MNNSFVNQMILGAVFIVPLGACGSVKQEPRNAIAIAAPTARDTIHSNDLNNRPCTSARKFFVKFRSQPFNAGFSADAGKSNGRSGTGC